MIRYSVLIPERNAGTELARQLPELRRVLDQLSLPYEVICVDASSGPSTRATLEQMLRQHACLRVLTLDRPAGLGTALAAGIASARGELVVALGPGKEYPVHQIPHLISELSQADVVFGRQKRIGWGHAWRQMAGLPRRWLLGLSVRSPDCLFWAARREAVAGLDPARGAARLLPYRASARGYRVVEVSVRFEPARAPVAEAWPNPGDLLAAWWLRRRFRPAKVEELRIEPADMAKSVVVIPGLRIDAVQGLTRHDAETRQRDSA
jgi:dolichol-phosphate mannosyltransferase